MALKDTHADRDIRECKNTSRYGEKKKQNQTKPNQNKIKQVLKTYFLLQLELTFIHFNLILFLFFY